MCSFRCCSWFTVEEAFVATFEILWSKSSLTSKKLSRWQWNILSILLVKLMLLWRLIIWLVDVHLMRSRSDDEEKLEKRSCRNELLCSSHKELNHFSIGTFRTLIVYDYDGAKNIRKSHQKSEKSTIKLILTDFNNTLSLYELSKAIISVFFSSSTNE